jgi:CRP-like cAMP-binding protein
MRSTKQTTLEALQRIGRRRRLAEGEAVFRQGQRADAIYRVITGEVHLLRHSRDGKTVLLHRASDGEFFAEASLDASHYHCTAMCIRPTELQMFAADRLRTLLQDDAGFAFAWISRLSSELRRQRAGVERLSLKSAADRLCHYLMTEGDPPGELQLSGTLSQLAEALGLSREALYRTLAELERQGRLQRENGRLRLLERED